MFLSGDALVGAMSNPALLELPPTTACLLVQLHPEIVNRLSRDADLRFASPPRSLAFVMTDQSARNSPAMYEWSANLAPPLASL